MPLREIRKAKLDGLSLAQLQLLAADEMRQHERHKRREKEIFVSG